MEGPEDSHQPSPTTIFSQVLGPLADRQEVEESSTRSRDRAVECTPPTLRWEQEDHFMLVVTSSMNQLTIVPDGNKVRRGGNFL